MYMYVQTCTAAHVHLHASSIVHVCTLDLHLQITGVTQICFTVMYMYVTLQLYVN